MDAKEAQVLSQEDQIESLEKPIGDNPWLTLFWKKDSKDQHAAGFSALIPQAYIETAFTTSNWDLSIGGGVPGSIGYGDGHEEYKRFGNDAGIEPIVFHRHFSKLKPAFWEISEEFRHFHNLYPDLKNNKLIKFDESGDEDDVVTFESDLIRVKLGEMRDFLATKGLVLVLFSEVFRFSKSTIEELGLKAVDEDVIEKEFMYHRVVRNDNLVRDGYKSFSLVRSKRLVHGETSQEDSKFEEFTIGMKDGKPVQHSCNPDALADFYGKNAGAPNYVMPVFFRRDVLTTYTNRPGKYTIEDGHLACGGLWTLRFDNNRRDYVVVMLGDLGYLSHKEQLYWKRYNVSPDGTFSDVAFKRGFLAEFTAPAVADLRFKQAYEDFEKKCLQKLGWDFFKPLGKEDQHYYTSLHVPVSDDQAELDSQALALAKILVDSINEAKIAEGLKTLQEKDKGLKKLEKYLTEKGLAGFAPHITFLHNLYNLRHGSGHRKGDDYERAIHRSSEHPDV